VEDHANLFAAAHTKLGRECRRHHRCEYFAPVWEGLKAAAVWFAVFSASCASCGKFCVAVFKTEFNSWVTDVFSDWAEIIILLRGAKTPDTVLFMF
jgi:hypothetical protein